MAVRKRNQGETNKNDKEPKVKKEAAKKQQSSSAGKVFRIFLVFIPIVVATYFVLTLRFDAPSNNESNTAKEPAKSVPVSSKSLQNEDKTTESSLPPDSESVNQNIQHLPDSNSDKNEEKLNDGSRLAKEPTESVPASSESPANADKSADKSGSSSSSPKTESVNENILSSDSIVDKIEEEPKVPKDKASKKMKTRKYDEDLLRAENFLKEKKFEEALQIFGKILAKDFSNPDATFGKFQCLDALAEAKRSNKILEEALQECTRLLDFPKVPKSLMLKAGRACADRQKFRGWNGAAMKTYRKLIGLYPSEIKLYNEGGVAGLLANKIEAARSFFLDVLKREPNNGFAKVHLGFILKTNDLNNEEAIPLLSEGIASGEEGTRDGRFYFHLGDAYYRDGQHDQAYKVYEEGAQVGLFRSMWQRSLYNVDYLESHPYWTYEQTGHADLLRKIEKNWKIIRDEGLAQLDKNGGFVAEDENLRERGDWKQLTLYARGRRDDANCRRVPKTCALVSELTDATSCSRGQIKFSVMHGGVHVWPHCGPTNCRIRAHLGLVIPDGPHLRVTDEVRTWKEGKFIIFDDSFEHEVWHNGTETRLVLIVDMWHPQLTTRDKATLSPI